MPSLTTLRARILRKAMTEAEKKLWSRLKRDQLGVRFRRQFSIGPYIADFACPDRGLVIELDGGQHAERKAYDTNRSDFLAHRGYRVLRFLNNEALENTDGVVEAIMNALKNSPLPVSLSPDGEREQHTTPQEALPSPRQGRGIQGEGPGETPNPAALIPPVEIKPSGLEAIRIQGGQSLNGTITVSGAKNAALKLMCATLLTDQPLQLTNMPVTLGDIRTLAGVLQHIGTTVALRADGVALFHTPDIKTPVAPYDLVRMMRASILVLGPLLARNHYAEVSLPGGCALGTRPVDFHIEGLRAMGADITLEDGYIKARAPAGGLRGAPYTFPKVSHTGTENLMMAATLAQGQTILDNAAREPEVTNLAECLIAMGAMIEGHGTSRITIQGVPSLNGAAHAVLPDRIETGTWMIAAGLTGGSLRLKNAGLEHLTALLGPLARSGVQVGADGPDILVARQNGRIRGIDIMTEPYPGFPTDLQAQMMTMLTLCEGAGMVTETIFENRFMHVPELCRMGANITVHGASALVRGVERLKGAEVMATDLRASVSLVLAGLVAEGETTVNRIYHLDRGYERIVEKLAGCGAVIERVGG